METSFDELIELLKKKIEQQDWVIAARVSALITEELTKKVDGK